MVAHTAHKWINLVARLNSSREKSRSRSKQTRTECYEHFNMSESDQSELYYPDENENINSQEEIQKELRFVIESDEED